MGTTRTDEEGYVRVKVVVGTAPWKQQHILVVEARIGRRLAGGEVVHHINGNRADNRGENLYLCRDRSHHNDVHRSQDVAFRKLLEAGIVAFRDGAYETVL